MCIRDSLSMGLFDKLKGKKESVDWSDAYNATPKFYGKPDGSPFGAIALTCLLYTSEAMRGGFHRSLWSCILSAMSITKTMLYISAQINMSCLLYTSRCV